MPRGVYVRSNPTEPLEAFTEGSADELHPTDPETINLTPAEPTIEQKIFELHVKGVGLSMIAAKLSLEPSEVFETVKRLEQKD